MRLFEDRSGTRSLGLLVASLLMAYACGSDDPRKAGRRYADGGESGQSGAAAEAGAVDQSSARAGEGGGGAPAAGADNAAGAAGGQVGTPFIVLQRAPRGGMGDIFDEAAYAPGARLVLLSDVDPGAQLSVICCDPQLFGELDISSYDLSFDATELVFAGRRAANQRWALYRASVASGSVVQLSSDPNHDYLDPVFVGAERIMFVTNGTSDGGAQYRDEITRSVTLQLGTMTVDGGDEHLAPPNLSHRRRPRLTADGRVLFDQWDALGSSNAGRLMFLSPDSTGELSGLHEAFGKEGRGVAAAHYNAREIAPGRFVALAGPVDGTFHAGALVDIQLGLADQAGGFSLEMSEANASARVLSDDVPLDRAPSPATAGRYADAIALDSSADPQLLVSWSDGPVQVEALGDGTPNFGVYTFDSKTGERSLVYDDPARWELSPRLLSERPLPPELAPPQGNAYDPTATLLGSLDVYTSSLFDAAVGSVAAVRVIEGYSSEEGFPAPFGDTPYEGAATLGVTPVRSDGSWAALVPSNVPLRLQLVDRFAMALQSTPVWISGRPGESLFCGGCHESRSAPLAVNPGLTQAIAIGPEGMKQSQAKPDRKSTDYTIAGAVGVPWDLALQPIFDAKCVSCHDGVAGPANPSWTVTDPSTGSSFTWSFNLSGAAASVLIAGKSYGEGFSASYLSLVPPLDELATDGLVITGNVQSYVEPGSARTSALIKKLNPPQVYPQDLAVRAFATQAHAAAVGSELSNNEYYLLTLMADSGGQFYSRENKP